MLYRERELDNMYSSRFIVFICEWQELLFLNGIRVCKGSVSVQSLWLIVGFYQSQMDRQDHLKGPCIAVGFLVGLFQGLHPVMSECRSISSVYEIPPLQT